MREVVKFRFLTLIRELALIRKWKRRPHKYSKLKLQFDQVCPLLCEPHFKSLILILHVELKSILNLNAISDSNTRPKVDAFKVFANCSIKLRMKRVAAARSRVEPPVGPRCRVHFREIRQLSSNKKVKVSFPPFFPHRVLLYWNETGSERYNDEMRWEKNIKSRWRKYEPSQAFRPSLATKYE